MTFTFRADTFSGCFYPKRLTTVHTHSHTDGGVPMQPRPQPCIEQQKPSSLLGTPTGKKHRGAACEQARQATAWGPQEKEKNTPFI